MVEITVDRQRAGSIGLSPSGLVAAVDAMRTDGFVVLKDAVDLVAVERLRDKMLDDALMLLAREDVPFNWNPGNLQQDPPPCPPFLFRDVLVNEAAIQVTKEILGPGLRNAFYSGNTALPSESRQPVHADLGQLWPKMEHPHPPYAIVVNVPLVDMDEANGSTEIWPGTHTDPTIVFQEGDIKVPSKALEARRNQAAPLQPKVSAGSIVLRDIRLWHAGMPNHTSVPRPMIAMIHTVAWWNAGSSLRFPRGTEPLFEHPDLKTVADFVDEDIDYIAAPTSYEYMKG